MSMTKQLHNTITRAFSGSSGKVWLVGLIFVFGLILSACGAEGLGVGLAEGENAVNQVNSGQQSIDNARDIVGAVGGQGVGQVPMVKYVCPADNDAIVKLMTFNIGISKLTSDEQVAARALYQAAALCGDTDMMVQYGAWSQR